jgi:hypothetical protein
LPTDAVRDAIGGRVALVIASATGPILVATSQEVIAAKAAAPANTEAPAAHAIGSEPDPTRTEIGLRTERRWAHYGARLDFLAVRPRPEPAPPQKR